MITPKERLMPNYQINKWIFRGALILCFIILLTIMQINNFDFSNQYIISCPEDSTIPCLNPFYCQEKDLTVKCSNDVLSTIEYLNPGESYGQKNHSLKIFSISTLTIFLLAFLINHLIYNKKVKK